LALIEYAFAHKVEETTVGLSLLCALPIGAVELALMDREMTLILAKARGFDWNTATALLFLGAKDHRIKARERLDTRTSREVLSYYRSRRYSAGNIRICVVFLGSTWSEPPASVFTSKANVGPTNALVGCGRVGSRRGSGFE
jgi:hypothetical protein